MDGLSNVNVRKTMLSSVKDSQRAYLEHLNIEQKKQYSQKRKKTISFRERKRKSEEMQKEELSNIEGLKKSNKGLNVIESKAEQMLQSACAFLDEGNERMSKGLGDKEIDQIEVTQRIIELAQEKQEEMESIHMDKRQLIDKLDVFGWNMICQSTFALQLQSLFK